MELKEIKIRAKWFIIVAIFYIIIEYAFRNTAHSLYIFITLINVIVQSIIMNYFLYVELNEIKKVSEVKTWQRKR